jgi:hypothetical protein
VQVPDQTNAHPSAVLNAVSYRLLTKGDPCALPAPHPPVAHTGQLLAITSKGVGVTQIMPAAPQAAAAAAAAQTSSSSRHSERLAVVTPGARQAPDMNLHINLLCARSTATVCARIS